MLNDLDFSDMSSGLSNIFELQQNLYFSPTLYLAGCEIEERIIERFRIPNVTREMIFK